jgi:DNA-binding transcriptional LysR family regulator
MDVAIRVGALQDSELSARRLGEITYGLYATPDYLGCGPALSVVSDLDHHDLIMKTSRGRSNWMLVNGPVTANVTKQPRAAVSSIITAKNLALEGLGITQLPRFIAEPHVANGELACVLPGWAEIPAPVHAVFPSSRYMDPKVRGFVDTCRKAFAGSDDSFR